MSNISLARIDFRLIHGQVITKWLRQTNANQIVVIDDELSKDSFMSSIYTMAAPPGIPVKVTSVDDAVKAWNNNDFENNNLFVLFKNVEQAYKAITKGIDINKLQIGGLGAGPGRKVVFGPITLDDNDVKLLEELENKKIEIMFHQVPEENGATFRTVLKNY